jgi:hypothetical protein
MKKIVKNRGSQNLVFNDIGPNVFSFQILSVILKLNFGHKPFSQNGES